MVKYVMNKPHPFNVERRKSMKFVYCSVHLYGFNDINFLL
jgi:hypothetical protein